MQKQTKKPMANGLKLLLLAVPFIIFIAAFSYVPLFGWIYAFFDYKPGIPLSQTEFVGFKYFVQIFKDGGELFRVMRNTLVMSGLGLLTSVFPAAFAILLNEIRSTRFRKLVQTTTTLPNFISWIIVYGLAFAIFSNDGMLSNFRAMLGMESTMSIMSNNDMVWIFQTLLGVWKGLGWGAIIYIATIAGIDPELFDAADIDGANRFQKIMNVTVPGMYSTFFVLLLLSISNVLNNGFDQYFAFFNPLVADRIEVLDYYVYKIGILTNDYPLSTALGMTKCLIGITLLFSANFLSKRVRGESIV